MRCAALPADAMFQHWLIVGCRRRAATRRPQHASSVDGLVEDVIVVASTSAACQASSRLPSSLLFDEHNHS